MVLYSMTGGESTSKILKKAAREREGGEEGEREK
jgi:hypothetical protein